MADSPLEIKISLCLQVSFMLTSACSGHSIHSVQLYTSYCNALAGNRSTDPFCLIKIANLPSDSKSS